jgi:hypothetical protein
METAQCAPDASDTAGQAEMPMADGLAKYPRRAAQESPITSEFADTALWGATETNKDGFGSRFDMPENLRRKSPGHGHGTRGERRRGRHPQNLIVRMQAPFLRRDGSASARNVHNFAEAKQVKVRLELEGNSIELPTAAEDTIEIPAGEERRVDWRVKVVREGEAVIRMLALTDAESDAVQMKFPVYVHGMLKMDSFSGAIRPNDGMGAFEVAVPNGGGPKKRGSRCVTRRRWPARWSTPCPTSSTILTAAPSKRSIASCQPS